MTLVSSTKRIAQVPEAERAIERLPRVRPCDEAQRGRSSDRRRRREAAHRAEASRRVAEPARPMYCIFCLDLHHVAMRNPKASALLCTHASCIHALAKRLHYTGAMQAGTAGTESTVVFQYGLRSLCSCGQS